MVSVDVSKLGCTEIHFIKSGIKVNGAYSGDNLLSQKLQSDVFQISQGWLFVFQQDGASSTQHRRFPEAQGARLMPPTMWTQNSPDLNPVNYSNYICAGVYCRIKFTDTEFLTSMNLKRF